MADLPIGIFDSGIGGLTVLKELASHLPDESFLFLGDTARLPYGSKSPETIRQYLIQNIGFLHGRGVKAVVVACNSASSVLRPSDRFPVPVFGVIEPGARSAVQASSKKHIGVLGTLATVNGRAYEREIQKLDPCAIVVQQACPLLVPLVEEGWEDDPVTEEIIRRYIHPIHQAGVDAVILGCTHYPVLKKSFMRIFGERVKLVDSALAISEQMKGEIGSGRIHGARGKKQLIEIMVTDTSEVFRQVATRLLAPLAVHEMNHVHVHLN